MRAARASPDFRAQHAALTLDGRASAERSISESEGEGQQILAEYVESTIGLERDLEHHFVNHLESLEAGLTLISRQETTDVGRIDILAHARDGQTVIIELGAGEARDAAIGQVARDIGWYTRKESHPPRAVFCVDATQTLTPPATACARCKLRRGAKSFPLKPSPRDASSSNAMAGALATRLFGAEARSAARLRRTRRQTRMFEAQPSLRVCLAARALEGSRSAAQAAKVKRRRRPGRGIAGEADAHAPFDTSAGRTPS